MSQEQDTARADRVLALPLGENAADAADAATVRGYLVELLRRLWVEGEGFSGKRPFGDSGWEYDLYEPLVKAGLVAGATLDEDGFLFDLSRDVRTAADALVELAIVRLGDVPEQVEP
jgi:hypothetical protein